MEQEILSGRQETTRCAAYLTKFLVKKNIEGENSATVVTVTVSRVGIFEAKESRKTKAITIDSFARNFIPTATERFYYVFA